MERDVNGALLDIDPDATEEIFEHDGCLVVRDKSGKCWALSPRDFQGTIPKSALKHVGKFRLVY